MPNKDIYALGIVARTYLKRRRTSVLNWSDAPSTIKGRNQGETETPSDSWVFDTFRRTLELSLDVSVSP